MTIKFKLLGIAAGVAVLLAILMGLGALAMDRLTAIKDTEVQVASSEAGMLLLRRREKDFLARLDPKYFESFQKGAAALQATLTTLAGVARKAGISHEKADQAAGLVGEYGEVFGDLFKAQEANGFDAQSGLRGEAQSAAARMRKVTDQLDVPTVLMDNLEMNLAEVVFLNQPDQSAVDRFRRFAGQLKNTLSILGANDIDRDARKELIASLAAYEKAFAAMAAKQQEIGFSEKEGLRGQMRGMVHKTETLFRELGEETRAAAAASVKQLYSVAVILFLVLVVVLAAAALLVARSIIKPVEALRDTMQSVQRNHDLSLRAAAGGRDEITAMGKAFNEMMDAFQQTVRTVQDASAQMSSSAEELSAITEQTSQGLMQQQGEVDQVATAINEMEATMAEVARNTETTAETSSRANDHATEGRSIVEQTIDVIQTLVAQAQQSSQTTTELKGESEEVVTVLDVIKAIADQTNLLALNAAIEAARAGEQGRGFAVVADEVRTLAQRSQKSATEIEEIISRLQGKTDEVVTAIESSRTQAEQCIQQALKAGDALSKITEAAGEIQQKTTQIASATEEQSAVAREINANISSIKMISDQSTGAVQQNSVASGEVAKQAAMLHSSIEQFRV